MCNGVPVDDREVARGQKVPTDAAGEGSSLNEEVTTTPLKMTARRHT